jgi:hypothetical protein
MVLAPFLGFGGVAAAVCILIPYLDESLIVDDILMYLSCRRVN